MGWSLKEFMALLARDESFHLVCTSNRYKGRIWNHTISLSGSHISRDDESNLFLCERLLSTLSVCHAAAVRIERKYSIEFDKSNDMSRAVSDRRKITSRSLRPCVGAVDE
jgi:hypothetical protein